MGKVGDGLTFMLQQAGWRSAYRVKQSFWNSRKDSYSSGPTTKRDLAC